MAASDPPALVLVDATNVMRSAAWAVRHPGAGLPELAARLVDAAASWAGAEQLDVLLVFDGQAPAAGSPACRVVGSGPVTADELLERAAAAARAARRPHWVVSSDRTVCQVAGAAAERTIGAAAFTRAMGSGALDPELGAGPRTQPDPGGVSRILDRVDESTRAALERMRRGE